MPLFHLPLRKERQRKRIAQTATSALRAIKKDEDADSDIASAAGSSQSNSDEDEHAKEDVKDVKFQNVDESGNGVRPSKHHDSQRYQHVEVLVTLIHRCIQTREWERALRGFSLLLRVPDVDIKLCYDMGLEILLHTEKEKAIEYLSRLIVAFPPLTHGTILRMEGHQTPRAEVFVRILTVHRIHQGRFHEAVDALDQWLLVPPFRDDRQLWQLYVAICKELEDQARQADDAAGRVKWKSKGLKAETMQHGGQAETASHVSSRDG